MKKYRSLTIFFAFLRLLLLLFLLYTFFTIVILHHLDSTARTLLSLTFCNLTPLFQPLKSFSSISLRTMALSLEVSAEKLSVCVTRKLNAYMALKESKYTYMST